MRILLKFILNNTKEHKLRTAVMLLSVILSAALIFISLAIGDSYESAQRKMAKGFAGTAVLSVAAKPDADGNVSWISEEEIPGLSSIKNKVGILTAAALYKNDGYFENLDLIAADINELERINRPRLLEAGKLTDFSGDSIVLPEKFTTKYGIEPGDDVVLTIGGLEYHFKLTAIAAYDTVFLRQTRGFNALLPKETLSGILHASKGSSKILIEPFEGSSADALKAELSVAISGEHYSIMKVYDEAQIASEAREKSLPFYLISFFSLTMSVFIIFSSYKVITIERLPIIGTFRSIGATEKETTGILMSESLVYGILGGIIAIPFGYIILKLILNGLGNSLSLGIEIPMVVKTQNIFAACGVAILISLSSAFIPVLRASKIPVKEVVLGRVESQNTSGKLKLVLGSVVFLLSVLLPLMIDEDNQKLLMAAGGFSLLGLIASAVIIIPLITNILSRILEPVYRAVFGNEGGLAARNMKDNRNINQNITLLFISLSAVIAISVVGSFAASYIGDVFAGASLDGFADGNMSYEFIKKVEDLEGMKEVLPIHVMENTVRYGDDSLRRVEAVDELLLYNSMLNISYDNKEMQESIENTFNHSRNILLNRDYLKKYRLKIGDNIRLQYKEKKFEYTIIGSFQSRADSSDAVIPAAYAESDFASESYGMLTYMAADPDAVMVQIRNLFGNKSNWSRTVEEFNHDVMSTINSFLQPMQELTYFILLLAAVGIINNLLINYIERRHAIAMYKSLGMSNRQNVKMMVLEGLTSGITGTSFGLFVSFMEIRTIFIVAGPRISVNPEIKPGIFIMAGLAGVLITLFGSVVPIVKSFRMKLVEEIKME